MDRGPPGTSSFMPPEATRLFDVALPLLMRSAPDRRNLWFFSYARVKSAYQPPAPKAVTRYSLADDDEPAVWAYPADR